MALRWNWLINIGRDQRREDGQRQCRASSPAILPGAVSALRPFFRRASSPSTIALSVHPRPVRAICGCDMTFPPLPHMRISRLKLAYLHILLLHDFTDPGPEPFRNSGVNARVTSHPVAAFDGAPQFPHARGRPRKDETNLISGMFQPATVAVPSYRIQRGWPSLADCVTPLPVSLRPPSETLLQVSRRRS